MDGSTELILAVIAEHRLHMTEGFRQVNDRLDILNGRTRRAEASVAVLEDRTEAMVCGVHGERFETLAQDANHLRADVETLKGHLLEYGRSPAERSAVVKWSVTAGAVAGALAILEGIWAWIKGGTHWWVHK